MIVPTLIDFDALCEQINQPPTLAHLLPWRIVWQPTTNNAPRPTCHHDSLCAAIQAIRQAIDAADEPLACRQDTRFLFNPAHSVIEVLHANSTMLASWRDTLGDAP